MERATVFFFFWFSRFHSWISVLVIPHRSIRLFLRSSFPFLMACSLHFHSFLCSSLAPELPSTFDAEIVWNVQVWAKDWRGRGRGGKNRGNDLCRSSSSSSSSSCC